MQNISTENETAIAPNTCYQPLSTFTIDTNFQTPKNICDYMVSMVPESAFKILEPTVISLTFSLRTNNS